MNIWCRMFGWDEYEWKEIVRTYGIRFKFRGHRYIIRPGTWLWILLYLGSAALGIFGLWSFCVVMILVFG